MNVLIENGAYGMDNLGDVTMLQVGVGRLRQLFPRANLQVLTKNPEKLARLVQGVTAIPARGRAVWAESFDQTAIQRLGWNIQSLEGLFRARARRIKRRVLGQSCVGVPQSKMEHWHNFIQVLAGADMLVVTGGGFVNDYFPAHALNVLRLVAHFVRHGKPVALFGQGLAPLTQSEMVAIARQVLPRAEIIAVRESVASVPILERLGVPTEQFEVTGDDAIAAVLDRSTPAGSKHGIGVNLRVADYSRVDAAAGARVKAAIRRAAAETGAEILGLPVASGANDNDLASMADLLGADGTQRAGQIQTPEQLIETVAQCRVVVTGSYHAAVFALSQGIPAIGLVGSEYYESKFTGLAALFGAGCHVFRLDRAREGDLEALITARYADGERFRPALLQAAETQRAKSAAAYERFGRQIRMRIGTN